jgi:hypothetical protein
MQEHYLKAEILVQRVKLWWTILALSAGWSDQFDELKFVRKASGRVRFLFADAALISSLPQDLHANTHVTVILWDGYQSYLEYKDAIDELGKRVRELEIRAVGDPSEWDNNCCDSGRLGLLFPQRAECYSREMLHPDRFNRFSFDNALARLEVIHRSKLISGKVGLQLLIGGRTKEYLRTKYVFCGQTGFETLLRHYQLFGPDDENFSYSDRGLGCDDAFITARLSSILRNRRHWGSKMMTRGLLRLVALRALYKSRREEIFLNVYPAININAYQTGMFFRRHVFLEFGGISGNEFIYPRTADIAFHGRQMIRFDSEAAIKRMMELDEGDSSGLSSFTKWYGEQVISQLDHYASTV